eukprot:gb/GECG01004471.1/.p1 GENE.gb/GECG01004471.1/~~gb/GECG01004471.1/.p1  ORF type:complete len:498 (+),score=19.36 gb/GECG01004471.1/:1-1494(+)
MAECCRRSEKGAGGGPTATPVEWLAPPSRRCVCYILGVCCLLLVAFCAGFYVAPVDIGSIDSTASTDYPQTVPSSPTTTAVFVKSLQDAHEETTITTRYGSERNASKLNPVEPPSSYTKGETPESNKGSKEEDSRPVKESKTALGAATSRNRSAQGTDPLECKLLAEYMDSVESTKSIPSNLKDKLIVDGKMNDHVRRLLIPGCGYFYFKLSCRPPLTYFWGRQAWPEIVGHELDKALGFKLTYPTIGIVLPRYAFSNGPTSSKCVFEYNNHTVFAGALTRSQKFVSDTAMWYKTKCSTKDTRFMEDLFRLTLLDYFLLNTDRHMAKNWIREGDKIVAADNGAWSFHDQRHLCDQDRYLKTVLYPVKIFASNLGQTACPVLERSPRPICKLVEFLRRDTINTFLQSTTKWQNGLEKALINDQWFTATPIVMRKPNTKKVEVISNILSRNTSSCVKQINRTGAFHDAEVTTFHVVRFISNEIATRYILAQKTVRDCLR